MKTQSALNNFDEFTMLDAGELAPYIGFTEAEVQSLCQRYQQDYTKVKNWYDGYFLSGQHIYNPKAVVSVMLRGNFQSYWSQTGTYESIRQYIDRQHTFRMKRYVRNLLQQWKRINGMNL